MVLLGAFIKTLQCHQSAYFERQCTFLHRKSLPSATTPLPYS
jgi:hypothetical protein